MVRLPQLRRERIRARHVVQGRLLHVRIDFSTRNLDLARRPPQVDYVLLFGPTEKEKFGMQFFLRFEPGFSALVFHGVSFTHGGCFISGCHVQL